MQRYDITEENYRQRFRVCKKKVGGSGRELVARLDDLAEKWLQTCKTAVEVKDRIVMEQLLNTSPEEVKVRGNRRPVRKLASWYKATTKRGRVTRVSSATRWETNQELLVPEVENLATRRRTAG